MGLGVVLNRDCVCVHPFGQAATNGVCQGFVGVHLLEALSQLFDVSDSPFNSCWMLALEEVLCVFFCVTNGAFGR